MTMATMRYKEFKQLGIGSVVTQRKGLKERKTYGIEMGSDMEFDRGIIKSIDYSDGTFMIEHDPYWYHYKMLESQVVNN